ncbi:FecR family protein [Sphingobacterium faecale]|uniref:FecR domain-containing protein n=1 Tax=Sphingobacterium faecale TaxID=2803775 RepID=A0ABS1R6I6_9SPHI|nr:FecR domain-containing protein [Sphingobacterium faecale]MBL1410311.1 FecR domain-containing protein [Sphingobacterium faecale]
MDKNRLQLLFDKYLNGTLTEAEERELDVMMEGMEETEFSDLVDRSLELNGNSAFQQDILFECIISRTEDLEPVVRIPLYRRWKQLRQVAAVILLVGLVGIVGYQLWNDGEEKGLAESTVLQLSTDIELPKDDALITLADGKRLSLADVGQDTLHYKGLALLRRGDGTIIMQQSQNSDFFQANEKHRFVAPKGVTLRLMLPDASVVNLNSDSQVEISSLFGKKQREVTLSGEAFFEVAHDKALPFVVHAKNAAVTVLGTQFNMSAYKADKGVATTLVSGSVQVDAAQRQVRIKPGQQAMVSHSAVIELNERVDMGQVLAWKEGYFRFKEESIKNIMTDLAKWYPIAGVEFKAGSTDLFTGSFKRSKKLSEVLANIEQVSDLRFDIQEGRVVVMK